MKNKTLILSLAAVAALFIAAPAFAQTCEVPVNPCKAPARGAADSVWTDYYSCMDRHIETQRMSAANHTKAIDAAMEQMREIHTFERK